MIVPMWDCPPYRGPVSSEIGHGSAPHTSGPRRNLKTGGMVDMVVARSDLPKTLGSILQTLTMKRKAA